VLDDLARQVAHWLAASRTFQDAEQFAAAHAWQSVEDRVGLPLRQMLGRTVRDLIARGQQAFDLVLRARQEPPAATCRAAQAVADFRYHYVQVETTLDFFGDAVNTRTSPDLRAALRTLDDLAVASMAPILNAARQPIPPVLTYVDKGMGASILRAGIRLWAPDAINPVAALKIVRHNLYRPTSLFHETGHQVAALTGWTDSLRRSLQAALSQDPQLSRMFTSWASEIVADVHAFLHTGFAAVAALYDVVGDPKTIFSWPVGDPHPIGWLRTLLGFEMCRSAFGPGPWDAMERAVLAAHPLSRAEPTVAALLDRARAELSQIAAVCVEAPVPGLGGRPATVVLDPARVAPAALTALEQAGGPALWTSPHWRRAEGIRLVALAGLREAEQPQRSTPWIDLARAWMAAPVIR
jgi:hypothetical protein